MRIVYKGTRSGKTRVAIITYGDSEENVAYDIVHEIRVATSYKVDTGVYGMLIVDVDDINDYNNFKECYKEFKKTALSEHTAEHTTSEQVVEEQATSEQTTLKVYTNIKKLSDNYYELEYYALRNNKIVGHGFEDFTRERIKTAVKFYDVKLLTGDCVTTTTGVTRRKKETLVHVVAVPVSVKKSDVITLVVLEHGENVEISKTYPHFFWYENFDSTISKIISHTVESEQTEAEATSEQTVEEQTTSEQPEHNKKYIVRAFENEKELTVQCPYFPIREYAIDYINNLAENGVVKRDAVVTINNSDIYDCFSDVEMTGSTTQIVLATDTLNEHYKRLCNDIVFEYKNRVYDDIDVESKDYYVNLNIYVTTLKKVLNGNHSRGVIRNMDKFEAWGNVYRTAMNFILSYNENKSDLVIKRLENKIRNELLE